MSNISGAAAVMNRSPYPPHEFPEAAFKLINAPGHIEEEAWDWYGPGNFYPVRIGEVHGSRYQVVGKLGFGSYGTIWLARDLL